MNTCTRVGLVLAIALLLTSGSVVAQRDFDAPFPAHRVMDNLYFVGTEGLGSFLVTTPEGHILINSDFERTVPMIRQSVETLGFDFEDIAIVLGSHAHGDHMQGDALVQELTGARVMAMEQDVPWLRRLQPGGKAHPIDRVLTDGEEVTLGGVTLTAHLTAGHTPGCTSWGLQLQEAGETYDALIVCSYGVNDNYVLVGPDANYEGIVDDYRATFEKARALPVDVFLGSHGFWYDVAGKYERMHRQPGDPNPFVDSDGYRAHVDMQEARFLQVLAEQEAAAR